MNISNSYSHEKYQCYIPYEKIHFIFAIKKIKFVSLWKISVLNSPMKNINFISNKASSVRNYMQFYDSLSNCGLSGGALYGNVLFLKLFFLFISYLQPYIYSSFVYLIICLNRRHWCSSFTCLLADLPTGHYLTRRSLQVKSMHCVFFKYFNFAWGCFNNYNLFKKQLNLESMYEYC